MGLIDMRNQRASSGFSVDWIRHVDAARVAVPHQNRFILLFEDARPGTLDAAEVAREFWEFR
jgi:hypothetical protein